MFHLAQVNVARLRFPLESPAAYEFVAALDRINHLADETGDPRMVLNLSVWQSYEQLHAYVYRSEHGRFVRRRYQWFERIATPATALWWVAAGHQPTPAEALARLRHLRSHGPTPQAFTVRCRFDPAGARRTFAPLRTLDG